jgi:DNA-binding response OmpR family regulator
VRGKCKQHDRYIDVETFFEGTTLRYVPVVETRLPPEPRVPPAEGEGETILLAEDDAAAREILAEVLRLSGYTVIEAKDGEDAVMLFRDKKEGVDLVFLDVRMPRKDGREVYEEIMKASPETAVLFMSGYTKDIIDSQRIIEQGLHFISKAASPEEMLTKIREVLDK